MPRAITRKLERLGYHSTRGMADVLATKIRDASYAAESLHLLPPLGLPFIPQTMFALSASAIRIVLNDVVLHQRRCVVELGAGMSTLYLSKILAAQPGSLLITIDHDAGWLARVADMLKLIGTESVVRTVHAPLEPPASPDAAAWYARRIVERTVANCVIDAVLVDGPKALSTSDAETRHPALPVLAPRLNPDGAVVFLDDVNRAGERRIYERWSTDFGFERVTDAEFCGLGILVPRDHPLQFRIV